MSGDIKSNAVFDGWAKTHPLDFVTIDARLKRDLVLDRVNPTDRILDIGCANGRYVRAVAPKCRSIVGIDISEPMLNAARLNANADNASFELQSADAMAFPDGSFDMAYSFSTVMLVENLERALKEACRVLRTGGLFIADFSGRWNLSHLYWNRYYKRQGHFGMSADSLHGYRKHFHAIGFTPLDFRATGLLDQWRYIPGLHLCRWINDMIHGANDLDMRASQIMPFFASRFYFVLKKD